MPLGECPPAYQVRWRPVGHYFPLSIPIPLAVVLVFTLSVSILFILLPSRGLDMCPLGCPSGYTFFFLDYPVYTTATLFLTLFNFFSAAVCNCILLLYKAV